MSKDDNWTDGDKGVKPDPKLASAAEPDGLLTQAQIDEIKKKARAEIMADKRGQMAQKILADEKQRLRNEEGLTTGNSHQDDMVTLTIDLPTYTPGININSALYWHGRTYTVPRHVAETLRDQMSLSWKHQNQIDGKGMAEFYAQKHVAELFKVAGGVTLSAKAA